MLNLGLHRSLQDALMATLLDSARVKTLIRIHDHDEKPVGDFQFDWAGNHFNSGSVQVDATGTPTRSLDLTVIDPKGRLIFTPSSPAQGMLYAGFFVSAEYCVWIPQPGRYPDPATYPSPDSFPGDPTPHDGGVWVHIPVFWGPLTRFESVGPQITLEGQGKEALMLDPYLTTKGYPIPKHTTVHAAIFDVAGRTGEQRFDIPELAYKLEHELVVHAESEPWKVIAGGEVDSSGAAIRGLIERTGKHPHHVHYNARGELAARRLNKEPAFIFDSNSLVSAPSFSFDPTKFRNHVVVRGAKTKGKHDPVQAEVSLPASHPLSPVSLARNGKPRFMTLFVDAGHLRTDRACAERAYHLLQHHSEIGVDASFDCLPIPMLEEHDVGALETDAYSVHFPIRQMTIPLTADQPMSIGSHKRAPKHRRADPGQGNTPGYGTPVRRGSGRRGGRSARGHRTGRPGRHG